MGGRYIITDIQLGLLVQHADKELEQNCQKLIESVLETQWIGQSQNTIIDDTKTLTEFYSPGERVSSIYLMTGVEIGFIISDINTKNFTKIMDDIHNIKQERKIGTTDLPIIDHVSELMKYFTEKENVLGEGIFTGVDDERETNEETGDD